MLLAAVTLAWALLQLVVLWPIGLFLTYDEAIYLSQVYPDTPALNFTAPRSRGITWLLAPVSVFEPSVGVLRGYLLGLYAVLFYLAFRAWLPVLGMRAVVAAAAFGSTWLALFYGTAIYPNLPVALGAVAATGYLARHLTSDGPGWPALTAAAAATAFVTLIRPIDGTLLAVAIGLAALTRDWRVLSVRAAAVGLAVIAGWAPWFVEAYQRFGGVRSRFEAASTNVGSGELDPLNIVRQHFALTDGPVMGQDDTGGSVIGLLWWLVLAVAVLAAGWQGLRRRPELLAPSLAALAFAAEYTLLTSVVTARFLLPCYALAAVCLAATVPVPAKVPYRVAVGVLLTAWLAWNLPVAVQVNETALAKRQERAELGAAVRAQAQGRDCVLAALGNFPEMAFAGGCYGVVYKPRAPIKIPAAYRDATLIVLTTGSPERSKLLSGPGELQAIDTEYGRRWWLFIPAQG